MRCAICGHAIQPAAEPIVTTTMGEPVHISCADRDAQRAYHWRTYRAAMSASVAIGLLALAVHTESSDVALLGLLLILAAAHVHLNKRWWHLTILPRRRRWR
jgi:hypothetical protein